MTFSGAKFISAFDLYDLLLNGDTFEDTRLQSGDARYIPKVKKPSQRMMLRGIQRLMN